MAKGAKVTTAAQSHGDAPASSLSTRVTAKLTRLYEKVRGHLSRNDGGNDPSENHLNYDQKQSEVSNDALTDTRHEWSLFYSHPRSYRDTRRPKRTRSLDDIFGNKKHPRPSTAMFELRTGLRRTKSLCDSSAGPAPRMLCEHENGVKSSNGWFRKEAWVIKTIGDRLKIPTRTSSIENMSGGPASRIFSYAMSERMKTLRKVRSFGECPREKSPREYFHVPGTRNCLATRKPQCTVCYDLPICDQSGLSSCPHGVEIPLLQLRRSAQNTDCTICYVLFGLLRSFLSQQSEDLMPAATLIMFEHQNKVRVMSTQPGEVLQSRVSEEMDIEREYYTRQELYSGIISKYSGTPNLTSSTLSRRWFFLEMDLARVIRRDPNSPTSHTMMKRWLSNCIMNHQTCRELAAVRPYFAPKRLLHILSSSRLSLSTEHANETKFVALSYCWGTQKVFSTTDANLSDHVAGISWEMLPKTFKEAVRMTLALGYEYLWIDALCILQDNQEDWSHQSTQMANIYSNAVFVISADEGQSVQTGFLSHRDHATVVLRIPPWMRARDIVFSGTQNIHQRHQRACTCPQLIRGLDRILLMPVPFGDEDHTLYKHGWGVQSPTFERAWCFQEQLLATRVIHFTRTEIFWECVTEASCECGRVALKSRLLASRQLQATDKTLPYDHESYKKENLYLSRWRSINVLSSYIRGSSLKTPSFISSKGMDYMWPTQRIAFLNRMDISAKNFGSRRVLGLLPTRPGRTRGADIWWSLVKGYSARQLNVATDRLPAIAGLAERHYAKETGKYYAGLWEKDLPEALLWGVDTFKTTCEPKRCSGPETYVGPTWSWISVISQIDEPLDWEYRQEIPRSMAVVVDIQCIHDSASPFGAIRSASITLCGLVREDMVECELEPGEDDESYLDRRIQEGVEMHLDFGRPRKPNDPYSALFFLISWGPNLYDSRRDDIGLGLVLVESGSRNGAYERIGIFRMLMKRNFSVRVAWTIRTVTIV